VLEGELQANSGGAFPVGLSASETAPAAVRITAFDMTLDGRRYGERFDVIVETKLVAFGASR
jgi:hypothetical protein